MTEDADTGERAFTVRGVSTDEFVLRFDANGDPIVDERGSAAEAARNPDEDSGVVD